MKAQRPTGLKALSVLAVAAIMLVTSAPAHASPVLTAAGTAAGFTLDTFASGGPTGYYPFLAGAAVGGNLVVVDQAGFLRLFTDVNNHAYNSQLTSLSVPSVINIANAGGNTYASVLGGGLLKVGVGVGPTLSTTPVSVPGFAFGYGLAGNPVNGHLYAPFGTGGAAGIYDINPLTGVTSAIYTGAYIDGVSVSPDGKTVYGAAAGINKILGFDIATHAQVFSLTQAGADGTGVIAGGLYDGYVISNNNNGSVYLINPSGTTSIAIITGLNRGDFTSPDTNNGTLLLADFGASYRLGAPGGSFGISSVPEPASVAVFGVLAVGGAVCGWRRRRQAAVA